MRFQAVSALAILLSIAPALHAQRGAGGGRVVVPLKVVVAPQGGGGPQGGGRRFGRRPTRGRAVGRRESACTN